MIMRGGYFKKKFTDKFRESLQRISQRGGDPAGDLKKYIEILSIIILVYKQNYLMN